MSDIIITVKARTKEEWEARVAELERQLAFAKGRDKETLEACQHWIAEFNRVEAQVRELADALRIAKCPNCDGSGATIRPGYGPEYVSHEMAVDAGDLSLEGSVYREAEPIVEQCQWCAERQAALAKLGGGIT